jgi:hypothetical protein
MQFLLACDPHVDVFVEGAVLGAALVELYAM